MQHILSIDLEDWYTSAFLRNYTTPQNATPRIKETTARILSLFRKHHVKATFFTLGMIAEKHPDLVVAIHNEGHEIASHGYSHTPLWNLTSESLYNELTKTNDIIYSLVGEKPIGFRAPYASLTQNTAWAIPVLQELGFRYDSSIFPMKTPMYGVENAPLGVYSISENDIRKNTLNGLLEIPFSVYKTPLFSIPCTGGIYGRVLPLPILSSLLQSISKRRPINFYFHPWEIDRNPITIEGLPFQNRLLSFYGSANYLNKVDKLLQRFTFTTFKDKFKDLL